MAREGEDKMNSQLVLTSQKEEDEASKLIEITTYIREALDLLIEKHIVAIDLRKNIIVKRP
jgi:hypothetical protein